MKTSLTGLLRVGDPEHLEIDPTQTKDEEQLLNCSRAQASTLFETEGMSGLCDCDCTRQSEADCTSSDLEYSSDSEDSFDENSL